jgi:hypothetical protein
MVSIDRCFNYTPNIIKVKTKFVTLSGSYKGGPEIRAMFLEQIRKNEKFFNEK